MRLHVHESDRIESLRSYEILDTAPEAEYDAITRVAALLCQTPISLISLVDSNRQWFKSSYGLDAHETPRRYSFCSHVVADEQLLVVTDARHHKIYASNPLVTGSPGVRAFAGVPLIGRDGLPLGSLCVIDRRPRRFTADQIEGLTLLASQAVALLELRRADRTAGRTAGALIEDATRPTRLRKALDDGELFPMFQPIVDLATSQILGFEALLRWNHPQHGVLPPSLFLPAVESCGLMLPVGRRVLDCSLAMLADLRTDETLPLALIVGVNVSGVQLQRPGLANAVADALRRHDLPAAQLSIEITETAPLLDSDIALRELTALRELGVHLALDDYGIGFSGLSRLLELPWSALKLDQSLVARLPDDPRSVAVTRSTFELAAEMHVNVVCEGVETEHQRRTLLALGGKYGQGWLFGSPIVQQAIPDHLRKSQLAYLVAS